MGTTSVGVGARAGPCPVNWAGMEKVRAAATIPWSEMVDFTAEAFAATGVPPVDARKAAEALVDADLH